MAVDWNAIGVTLTSTAVVVAGLAFMAKAFFTQFLKHDIEISQERAEGRRRHPAEKT